MLSVAFLPPLFNAPCKASRKYRRNSWASCWADPMYIRCLLDNAIFKSEGFTLRVEVVHIWLISLTNSVQILISLAVDVPVFVLRIDWDDPLSDRTNFVKSCVWLKHCNTEFIKHVFPMFQRPHKPSTCAFRSAVESLSGDFEGDVDDAAKLLL